MLRKKCIGKLAFSLLLMAVCHLMGIYFGALMVGICGAVTLFLMYRNIQRLEAISMRLEQVYGLLEKSVDLRVMMVELSRPA